MPIISGAARTIMSAPELRPLGLDGLMEIVPRRHGDVRGYFAEVWRDGWIEGVRFVQDNHSLSRMTGTLRGLHFQLDPAAQAKLVRVVAGAVFDVAVDVRPGSPSFGQWAGATLTAERGNMLFVPAGFAHGYATLEPDSEVAYKASATYDPALERVIRWDDPAIAIDWPLAGPPILSPRDAAAPTLADIRHEL